VYLLDDQIENDTLRQGDIIRDVHCIGALNLNTINYMSSASGEPTGWQVTNKPDILDAMVLSHSCEVAKENKTKVTSIILAPIRNVNSATKPEKIQELIESNIVRDGITATYLKYFYLEPNEKLSISTGSIVDFSKCFSVRKKVYDNLLDKKAVQLNDETSSAMALKLSLYYFRTQQAMHPENGQELVSD
jgi:hypothetical protein